MSKILALDYGEKRIGYAVSDVTRTIAFPREALAAKPEEKFFAKLKEIVRVEGISKIIIGVPLDEDNEDTVTSRRAKKFGEAIARHLMLPIEFIDEFNSTKEALSKIPFRKDRRKKGVADAIAAQIILQRYLDYNT